MVMESAQNSDMRQSNLINLQIELLAGGGKSLVDVWSLRGTDSETLRKFCELSAGPVANARVPPDSTYFVTLANKHQARMHQTCTGCQQQWAGEKAISMDTTVATSLLLSRCCVNS